MKTSITIKVFYKSISRIIKLPTIFKIFICTLYKVILVHKIISRIIRWVNINHLDFSKISFLQQLQHFKVVALDIKIFSIIKIYTSTTAIWFSLAVCSSRNRFIISHRAQCLIYRGIGKKNRLLLVRPSKLIAFLLTVNNFTRNLLHKYIFINSTNYFASFINCFSNSIRKHCR